MVFSFSFFIVRNLTETRNSNMANLAQKNYPREEDFPDLTKHNNWMATCLTPDIYKKLRDVQTPNGVTIDQVSYVFITTPSGTFFVWTNV